MGGLWRLGTLIKDTPKLAWHCLEWQWTCVGYNIKCTRLLGHELYKYFLMNCKLFLKLQSMKQKELFKYLLVNCVWVCLFLASTVLHDFQSYFLITRLRDVVLLFVFFSVIKDFDRHFVSFWSTTTDCPMRESMLCETPRGMGLAFLERMRRDPIGKAKHLLYITDHNE